MKKISLLAVVMLLLCTSCCEPIKPTPQPPKPPKQNETPTPPPVVTPSKPANGWKTKVVVINASDYTKWVYLNFAKGELVEVTNPETDLSWDLGLHRYDFKTNGGTSGKGKGAAVRITKQKVITEDIPTPKDSEWTLDREGLLLMQFTNEGGGVHQSKYEKQMANFCLSSECDGYGDFLNKGIIRQEGMPPEVSIDNAIYLIRSASGDIVRLRVHDYRKFENEREMRGYITLEYAIKQENNK